jgi:hypothetical protein
MFWWENMLLADVAPEPSGTILLGGGLLPIAGALRLKRAAVRIH